MVVADTAIPGWDAGTLGTPTHTRRCLGLHFLRSLEMQQAHRRVESWPHVHAAQPEGHRVVAIGCRWCQLGWWCIRSEDSSHGGPYESCPDDRDADTSCRGENQQGSGD